MTQTHCKKLNRKTDYYKQQSFISKKFKDQYLIFCPTVQKKMIFIQIPKPVVKFFRIHDKFSDLNRLFFV